MIATMSGETSANLIQTGLKAMLADVIPDLELRLKAELAAEINRVKKEKNAIILGHNYMEPALFHTIPDYVGDSLDLARRAASTDKEIIVFCGVRFMAETAKLLNPSKMVLIPSKEAGCSLAASITAADVRELRQKFPGVPVVTYVNTYADVKAESDICCTSSNAVAVVESLGAETVIFLPDEYLAKNIAAANPEKEMLRLCSVRCPHMNQITLEDTLEALVKEQYVIEIPAEIRIRAARAVERMIAIG